MGVALITKNATDFHLSLFWRHYFSVFAFFTFSQLNDSWKSCILKFDCSLGWWSCWGKPRATSIPLIELKWTLTASVLLLLLQDHAISKMDYVDYGRMSIVNFSGELIWEQHFQKTRDLLLTIRLYQAKVSCCDLSIWNFEKIFGTSD